MAKKIKTICTYVIFTLLCINMVNATESGDNGSMDVTRVEEVSELRTENSDTWLLSDGSYECVVYSYDKYTRNFDGKMVLRSSEVVAGSSGTMDTYVSSKYPDATYYANQYLRTGYGNDYGIRRSYLKFVLPTSTISGKNIYQAYIKLKYVDSAATPNVDAYYVSSSWSSSTTTWNNIPSNNSNLKSSKSLYSSTESTYSIYISEIMKSWAYGDSGRSNFGVLLKSASEGTGSWATFYSSDSIAANKPELHIFYANRGAYYLGITATGYDHSSFLSSIQASYLSMGMNSSDLGLYCGSYTKSQVKSFLDNDTDSLFISRSHGSYDLAPSGSQMCTKIMIDENGGPLYLSNIDIINLDLSNLRLAAFVGSYTGRGGADESNLPATAEQKGATCAIGFTGTIDCSSGNLFATKLAEYLSAGYNINAAYNKMQYDDGLIVTSIVDSCIVGNKYITFN